MFNTLLRTWSAKFLERMREFSLAFTRDKLENHSNFEHHSKAVSLGAWGIRKWLSPKGLFEINFSISTTWYHVDCATYFCPGSSWKLFFRIVQIFPYPQNTTESFPLFSITFIVCSLISEWELKYENILQIEILPHNILDSINPQLWKHFAFVTSMLQQEFVRNNFAVSWVFSLRSVTTSSLSKKRTWCNPHFSALVLLNSLYKVHTVQVFKGPGLPILPWNRP